MNPMSKQNEPWNRPGWTLFGEFDVASTKPIFELKHQLNKPESRSVIDSLQCWFSQMFLY